MNRWALHCYKYGAAEQLFGQLGHSALWFTDDHLERWQRP